MMADRHDAGTVSLDSDVLIAPHHGGNNGGSTCFVERVSPLFVVFSAGNIHQHPSSGAAGRVLAAGVQDGRIFRTDRGDDEPGNFEWKRGSINGCKDRRGDDDVDIVMRETSFVDVEHRQTSTGC